MKAAAVLLVALLPLGSLALSPFRIFDFTDPAPWEVCEALNPTECAQDSDRCALCKDKFAGTELCFSPTIAKGLPAFIFNCTGGEPPEPAVQAAKPAPWEVCEAFTPAQCQGSQGRCFLCTNKASGAELCFDQTTAAALPPFIFKCSGLEQPAPIGGRRAGPADGADAGKKKPEREPAPWEVCESFTPAECKRDGDRCSLCKEQSSGIDLCFRPDVAAKLPPFIFKCSGVKALAAADKNKPDPEPKPAPWVACEAFNATECAAHDKDCAVCDVVGKKGKKGKQMCFGLEIAKTLPPFIFHCQLPEDDQPAEQAAELAAANAEPALVDADGGSDNPKPAPWVACEAFNATECHAHKAVCAECTVMGKKSGKEKPRCFSPVVAQFLPPDLFHCKLPKEAEVESGAAAA